MRASFFKTFTHTFQDKYTMKNIKNLHQFHEDIDFGHKDDEPGMIQQDLFIIKDSAQRINDMLEYLGGGPEQVDFPHWLQSKIIKAKEYIKAAADYMQSEIETSLPQANLATEAKDSGFFGDSAEMLPGDYKRFLANYKKLNPGNVISKINSGPQRGYLIGHRKGELKDGNIQAHFNYNPDTYKINFDIPRKLVLGLINFPEKYRRNHPWS